MFAGLRSCALAIGLCVALAPRIAAATGLNTERLRVEPDEQGLSGDLQLGVNFSAGNVNRLDLRTSAALGFRRGQHLVFLIGNSSYSTRTRAIEGESLAQLLDDDSRFINRADLHLRYNYDILPWLTAELFGQVERNEFLLVESRVLFGVGPRFVPVKNDEFTMAIGTDYMLEYEALESERVVRPLPAQTLVHRWSSYLTFSYDVSERLTMRSTTYLQPRFDLLRDLRLLTEGMLEVVLLEPVTLRLFLRLRWDSDPSEYCRSAVPAAGCPMANQVRLREVDLTVENAIAVSF